MKKLLFLFVLISSCSTSTEKPIENQPQDFYRVVERIEKHLNGEVFGVQTYEYNSKGFISKIKVGSSSEITFQYNGKNQLISQQSSSQTTTYTYDENLIISSQLTKDSNTTLYRTVYQYNSNKELVRSANYVDDQFINESNYKFENGNLILEDSEITFDDKINARYAMGHTEAFLNIDTYHNQNNPLTTSTTKWTYKYNDEGYTVEETWYKGEDPAFFIIYKYETLTF